MFSLMSLLCFVMVTLMMFLLSFWIFEMQIACKNYPDDPEAQRAIDLLYDTALMSSGFTVSSEYLRLYLNFHLLITSSTELDIGAVL